MTVFMAGENNLAEEVKILKEKRKNKKKNVHKYQNRLGMFSMIKI